VADVAVVAHSRKTLGGGLPELRQILAREGVTDPLWYEVEKSRRAPKYARRAAAKGADVLFVWGGDGSVQRCIDAVAGTDTAVAILPAGTANLLAENLNVPHDLEEAVRIGLHGDRRRLDTGSVNGERFTVMAGAGFDARMISDADRGTKDRLGRAAYVITGLRNLGGRRGTLLALGYAAIVVFAMPSARSPYSPLYLALVFFSINGVGFALAALTPLSARYASVKRFYEQHGRRIVVADAFIGTPQQKSIRNVT